MVKTRRSGVPFVGLLLMFACGMQGNLLASYAQSTSAAKRNTYFILGAVKKPGVYRIESAPSLLKLLVLAGGLADSHGAVAFIMREPARAGQDPAFKVIQARIDELLKGNLEEKANLEPGDIVSIPPADVFFVAGEVNLPGSFPFKEGITLLQAISVARRESRCKSRQSNHIPRRPIDRNAARNQRKP
jgi:protein involved in polysaccharide export with SLBB domain